MSFNFASNNINQFKAQAAYKDGGGMGGGGMYMKQKKKRQNEQDDDIFEFSNEKDEKEIFISRGKIHITSFYRCHFKL